MREEIVIGLKNALERGYSLEQASQSFINAGYSSTEVKEAVMILTSGATTILGSEPALNKPKPVQEAKKDIPKDKGAFPVVNQTNQDQKDSQEAKISSTTIVSQQTTQSEKPKGQVSVGLIITLIIVLLILIAALVGVIYFKEDILSILV